MVFNNQQLVIQFEMSMGRNEKETVLDMLINPRPNDQIERKQKDKELLDLIHQKNYEIDLLHQVNTRLGAELVLLQKKLGIDHDIILKELENLNEISVAFHYETGQLEYLDHLLLAYDENSIKQKKLIALLFSELEDAERKAENLVRDNEYLLQQNQNKCKKILQIYHKGNPQDSLVPSYNKLQREMEVERIETLREENQYLTRYSKELEAKSNQLQEDLEDAKHYAEKYFESFKTQAEDLKNSLIQIDDLLKIKQVLEKKFDQISQENIELQSLREQLQNKVNKLDSEYKNLKNQFFSFKKSSRQDLERNSIEVDTLRAENQKSTKSQRENFNKLMIMEKQLENSKEQSRSSKRQVEKLKGDFEQTLKMCEAYESKIASFTRKQENVRNIFQENKERLDGTLLERDKSMLKVEQLEKLIENINSKNRDEMINLKTTFEKIINSQSDKLKVLEEEREEIQSSFSQNQLSLRNQVEKLRRQNSLLRQENARFINGIKTNSGSEIINRMKELEEKNNNLNKIVNQKQRSFQDEKEHNEEIIRNLQNQNRELTRLIEKERLGCSNAIKELTQQKSKASILRNDKECLESEIVKLKRNLDIKISSNHEQKQWKIKQLEQKLYQSVKKERETKAKAIELLEKYDQSEEKLKLQYLDRIQELERENLKFKFKIAKHK